MEFEEFDMVTYGWVLGVRWNEKETTTNYEIFQGLRVVQKRRVTESQDN